MTVLYILTHMVSAMIPCLQLAGQSHQYCRLKKEHDKRNKGHIAPGQLRPKSNISICRYDGNPCNSNFRKITSVKQSATYKPTSITKKLKSQSPRSSKYKLIKDLPPVKNLWSTSPGELRITKWRLWSFSSVSPTSSVWVSPSGLPATTTTICFGMSLDWVQLKVKGKH